MIIQTAVICDAATDTQGKLNLLGAFDTIHAAALPTTHPQCAIAFRVIFDRMEEGARLFNFKFSDEDGNPFIPPIQVPVRVSFSPDINFLTQNIILNLQNLRFERAGSYSFEVAAGSHHVISIPLAVRLIQPSPVNPETLLPPSRPV